MQMQTWKLRFKPMGPCKDVLIEARDLDYAQAVADRYCEGHRVTKVFVELNTVATEGDLTPVDIAAVELRKRDREVAAVKEREARERPVEARSGMVTPTAGKWPAMGRAPMDPEPPAI